MTQEITGIKMLNLLFFNYSQEMLNEMLTIREFKHCWENYLDQKKQTYMQIWELSEADAIAEGLEGSKKDGFRNYLGIGSVCAEVSFETLWKSINAKKHPWNSNPWVWVYDFERIEKPESFI